MGRRVKGNFHARCQAGENLEISSKDYLLQLHRQPAIVENWKPFKVEMPLIDNPIVKGESLNIYNIKKPLMYDLGFSHNNFNGRFVKAMQGHFTNLLQQIPEVFKKTI